MAQKSGKEGSVAPRERVNIVYKTFIGDAEEEIELPFRFLVMGDFTGRPDDTPEVIYQRLEALTRRCHGIAPRAHVMRSHHAARRRLKQHHLGGR